MKKPFLFVPALIAMFFLAGCATAFKGYKDKVDVVNAPFDVRVFTKDGVEIPVDSTSYRYYSNEAKRYQTGYKKYIALRSNKDHILTLKSQGKERTIEMFSKINFGWVVLDVATGVFPAFFDAYTGNWNKFEPINISF
ncbi:MAG: hypothetical protein HF314_10860 [Ignavibacteria bacterium]|jgi:hypothetical protein|nr:hypothetical protein [Ignavibacteria bacterium]MCU7503566.1 hypothetical protein [Ignavibacteria bacterium]MCU7516780.1 hypothetical protein [Ignavibacteria bacterium]